MPYSLYLIDYNVSLILIKNFGFLKIISFVCKKHFRFTRSSERLLKPGIVSWILGPFRGQSQLMTNLIELFCITQRSISVFVTSTLISIKAFGSYSFVFFQMFFRLIFLNITLLLRNIYIYSLVDLLTLISPRG